MKKHMLRLTLISFVTLSVFSSCKKDKDDDKLAVTVESLTGNYKLVDIKTKSNLTGNAEVSTMSELEECEKDDVYQLKSNGDMAVVDEGKKCDNDDTGTWSLKDNKITLNAGFYVLGTYEVISLTKSQLIGSFTMSEGGITITQTIYLSRQ